MTPFWVDRCEPASLGVRGVGVFEWRGEVCLFFPRVMSLLSSSFVPCTSLKTCYEVLRWVFLLLLPHIQFSGLLSFPIHFTTVFGNMALLIFSDSFIDQLGFVKGCSFQLWISSCMTLLNRFSRVFRCQWRNEYSLPFSLHTTVRGRFHEGCLRFQKSYWSNLHFSASTLARFPIVAKIFFI